MTDQQQGRPTTYSYETAERICVELSTSDATLAEVCGKEGMPNRATVFRWLAKYPEFRDLYAHAREFQTETLYDDMADIADAPFDESPVLDSEGEVVGYKVEAGVAMAEIQRRKLRIDVIKFKLVKLQAKRFGDRSTMDVNVDVKHKLSREQFDKLLATAAAPVQIQAPDSEEAEYTLLPSETLSSDMSQDDMDQGDIDDWFDDDLG